MHRANFILEGLIDKPLEGWTEGKLWNGWATPYFTADTALHIVNSYNSRPDKAVDEKAWYEPSTDTFYFASSDFPNEPEEYHASEHVIEGQLKKLYAIGAWYWVWEVEVSALEQTLDAVH